MLDCSFFYISKDNHPKPITFNIHTHLYDELVYYESGSGTIQIGEKLYPYKGGTFVFIRAGTPHNEINNSPCKTLWLHATNRIPGLSLQEGLFSDPQMKLLAAMEHLRTVSAVHSPYRDILTESSLAQCLAIAAELQQPQDISSKSINWQKILAYLNENISSAIDFSDLAARHHYSYDRFRHLFQEQFGLSPQQYVISQRINHAKRLLQNTSLSSTDIAYNCGFNSSSQFCNLFRKYTGTTPGAYRKYSGTFR